MGRGMWRCCVAMLISDPASNSSQGAGPCLPAMLKMQFGSGTAAHRKRPVPRLHSRTRQPRAAPTEFGACRRLE